MAIKIITRMKMPIFTFGALTWKYKTIRTICLLEDTNVFYYHTQKKQG